MKLNKVPREHTGCFGPIILGKWAGSSGTRNERQPGFADGPRGSPIELDLARCEARWYDFGAVALEFDGPSMHARIRTPTICVAPDSLIRETKGLRRKT